jgi:hypothetical protein
MPIETKSFAACGIRRGSGFLRSLLDRLLFCIKASKLSLQKVTALHHPIRL